MRSHTSFEPIVTKFCFWGRMGHLITDAKFYGNRLRGFRVTGPPPQTPFPILNGRRPYNSVSTTMLHCDWELWPPITSKRHDLRPRNFASRSASYAGTWARWDVADGLSIWENFIFFSKTLQPHLLGRSRAMRNDWLRCHIDVVTMVTHHQRCNAYWSVHNAAE